jgi:hypothetical protein
MRAGQCEHVGNDDSSVEFSYGPFVSFRSFSNGALLKQAAARGPPSFRGCIDTLKCARASSLLVGLEQRAGLAGFFDAQKQACRTVRPEAQALSFFVVVEVRPDSCVHFSQRSFFLQESFGVLEGSPLGV